MLIVQSLAFHWFGVTGQQIIVTFQAANIALQNAF